MPGWVFNLTSFPAFNVGFSVFFWMAIVMLPVLILLFLIKHI